MQSIVKHFYTCINLRPKDSVFLLDFSLDFCWVVVWPPCREKFDHDEKIEKWRLNFYCSEVLSRNVEPFGHNVDFAGDAQAH